MSVLLDTGVLYAFANTKQRFHEVARNVMAEIADGAWGRPVVTDFVVDELLTSVRMRKDGPRIETRAIELLALGGRNPLRLGLLSVDTDLLHETTAAFVKHRARGLSFTDASHLVVMNHHRIDHLATFDGGFEGLLSLIPEGFDRRDTSAGRRVR